MVDSTYHGYARLDAGVKKTFYSVHYRSDIDATLTSQFTINGGGDWAKGQVFTQVDTVPTDNYILSPCGPAWLYSFNERVSLTSTSSNVSIPPPEGDEPTIPFTYQLHLKFVKLYTSFQMQLMTLK
jgi:hypothetical protein